MEPEKPVRMANQIAANRDCRPDRSKAIAGVVDHLRRFWSPPMLDEREARMAAGDAGLCAVAEQALIRVFEERRAAG